MYNQCRTCGSKKVQKKHFSSEENWEEFIDSGLCEKCQDEIFQPMSGEDHEETRDLMRELYYNE